MNATRSNACAQSAAALCVSLAMLSCAGATRKNAASASSALPSVVTPEELASESELQAQNPPAAGAKAPAAAPTAEFPILYVSAEPIDVREFLSAMWLRASDTSKEVIDKLVVESIAVMEAERLGLAVSPTKVDEGLEAAWKALGDRLERQGHGVSVAQYLRTELNLDSETYRKRLRHESLAQLVTERDVRIWACTRERRILYIVELADQKALDAFSAGLAAGRDFDSLAKELHVHKDKQPAGNRTTLVKNDNVELSRVAFSTPEGQVAGPLEADGGRHLMIRVDKSLAPITGPWKEIAAAIEQSLVEDPVDEFEFIQWRSEMVKSYSVDTAPFFRIVGDAR